MRRAFLILLLILAAPVLSSPTVSTEDLNVRRVSQLTTYVETSAVNTQLTVSCAPGHAFRFLWASVKYSGAASVSVTTTLDSGAGATYDVVMDTVVLSAGTVAFMPATTDSRIFRASDAVVVTAPAVAAVTAAVVCQVEVIY